MLLKALDAGKQVVPPDTSATAVRNLLNKLGRSVWNVKLLNPYKHGRGMVNYLARHLRGGPIANDRLIALRGGRVYFTYREHREADPSQGRGAGTDFTPSSGFPATTYSYRSIRSM